MALLRLNQAELLMRVHSELNLCTLGCTTAHVTSVVFRVPFDRRRPRNTDPKFRRTAQALNLLKKQGIAYVLLDQTDIVGGGILWAAAWRMGG